MNSVYTYFDYEQAYFRTQWAECKIIGLYLLAKLNDDRAKTLYKRLEKFEYDWLHPTHEDDKIIDEVKIWLMVNKNIV